MNNNKPKFLTFCTVLQLGLSKNLQLSIILIFAFLFPQIAAFAQSDMEKKIEEIEQQVAAKNLSEKQMIEKYDSLMNYFYSHDIEKAKYYSKVGAAYAHENKNDLKESQYLTTTGKIHTALREMDSVLIYLDKALQLIEGKGYFEEEYNIFQERGTYFYETSNYKNAIDDYLKAKESNEKHRKQLIDKKQNINETLIAEVGLLNNIANIYSALLNVDKYIETQQIAIKIMDENPNVNFRKLRYGVPGNLADVYMYINQYEEAFPLLEKAYNLAAEAEDVLLMAFGLLRYVTYYIAVGNNKQALVYAKEAMKISEKTKHPKLINLSDINLMKCYFDIKDYKSSLYHAKRVLERTDEDDWSDLRSVYSHLALIYAALDDNFTASEYMNKYHDIMGKISDENMHNAIQEMEVKYDVQQKDFELERQQAEIEKQRTRQFIYLGGLVAAGLLLTMFIFIIRQRNRRARELAETNATKDKFFSIISHDLKNPAISQREALQLLYDNAEIWSASELKLYYQELLKSADGQVDLLYNLLNWSQVQTGRMPYNPTTFDLSARLRKTDITLLSSIAERKGVMLNVTMPDQILITGDDNMLATVIRNLLSNAIKFTSKGGTVTLEASPSPSKGGEKEGSNIKDARSNSSSFGGGRGEAYLISITDTGIGMSAEQTQELFNIDLKTLRSGTSGEKGVGLGLIVCKEFLEKHGSQLNIESEEGKGSKVWFEI